MVTKQGLLERVEGLLPGIAARAEESEQQRRPHDKTIQELIDAEVIQALVPQRFGGHELDLDTLTEVARKVSSACMSTGWVTAFYIGHNWMAMRFPEQAHKELFAHRPFGLMPVQTSPAMEFKAVPGGYEVSGRANWGSGVMHADWVMVAGGIGREDARIFLLPIGDVEVNDVWFMAGMAATGSNDILVDSAFVPEHRSVSAIEFFAGSDSIHENPLYAVPLMPFIYCEALGVYCGGLEGATAAYEALVSEKVTLWTGEKLANRQVTHVDLGDARARSRAANILLERLVADTIELAQRRAFDLDARIDLKLRAGYIADTCREAMNAMMSRVGSRAFRSDGSLQRYFRDLNTLASHVFVDWEVGREQYGRHCLGLPSNNPLV